MVAYVVLGLGRFGKSVARSLYEMDKEVLAIDDNEEEVDEVASYVTQAVCADCSDENVLKSLGVRNFDVGIVAIGGDVHTSIMTALLLKEMDVKYVVAKAQDELHAKVLSKLGVDRIIFPERDMGLRLAQSLTRTNFLDFIEISPQYSIVEIRVPQSWHNKSLKQLDVRTKHKVNVIAIKSGDEVDAAPEPNDVLKDGDILVVVGKNADVEAIK